VAGLHIRCCPATVARLVVAVVVDPVNGMKPGRPRPHIPVEVREVLAPSVTDLDAATAVVGVGPDVGVAATGLHANPDTILGHREPCLAVDQFTLDAHLPTNVDLLELAHAALAPSRTWADTSMSFVRVNASRLSRCASSSLEAAATRAGQYSTPIEPRRAISD